MANGEQAQGEGDVQGGNVQAQKVGGGRVYSEEDVMTLMNEAARRGATEAVKRIPREEEEEENGSVINPKVVKQLKDTVAVFTALKDLSSNPLQRTIEETVGGMAASVVQSAFAPRGPPPKKDIVETILNSQFAFGLGSGFGQRAPELVETLGRTFGTDKAGQMIENVIGRYGNPGGNSGQKSSRQLSSAPSPEPSGPPEQKADKQTEKELLLSLDPNNPEHVSAYAETQGGLPIEVARKMLMIHQDAFIEQMKKEGMNVEQLSTQRGSHSQPSETSRNKKEQQSQKERERENQQPIYEESPIEGINYAEYQDVQSKEQQDHLREDNVPKNDQQMEMMKTFATDIGKVMGDMLNKIESLNNTMFTLQSEVDTIKNQGTPTSEPSMILSPNNNIPPEYSTNKFTETSIENIEQDFIKDTIIPKSSSEFFEQDFIKDTIIPKSSSEFFEEDVKSSAQFLKELEEDAKIDKPKTKPITENEKLIDSKLTESISQPIPNDLVQSEGNLEIKDKEQDKLKEKESKDKEEDKDKEKETEEDIFKTKKQVIPIKKSGIIKKSKNVKNKEV
jgi:hypothetical protein